MNAILGSLLLLSLVVPQTTEAQNNSNNMTNTKNYSVEIIRYTIAPESHTAFEKAYAEAAKYLQASKYCLGYKLIHGNDEPNHYIVIIHWTSKDEHLNGFRRSAEFMPFFNLVKPYVNNIEEMKHYDLTPTAWQKE